jgi:hypothetical protein
MFGAIMFVIVVFSAWLFIDGFREKERVRQAQVKQQKLEAFLGKVRSEREQAATLESWASWDREAEQARQQQQAYRRQREAEQEEMKRAEQARIAAIERNPEAHFYKWLEGSR